MSGRDRPLVVLVNGSPRRDGATASILRAMASRLEGEHGARIRFHCLGDTGVAPCLGCCACYRTGSCCLHDGMDAMLDDVASCDALVLGTPTYASAMSGLLKTFVDRAQLVMEQALFDKRAVVVATYQNYGGSDAAKGVRRVVANAGALVSAVLVEKLPFGAPIAEVGADVRARAAADRLARDMAGRAAHPLQRIKRAVVFNAGIKPFALRQGDRYAGVIRRWQENGVG